MADPPTVAERTLHSEYPASGRWKADGPRGLLRRVTGMTEGRLDPRRLTARYERVAAKFLTASLGRQELATINLYGQVASDHPRWAGAAAAVHSFGEIPSFARTEQIFSSDRIRECVIYPCFLYVIVTDYNAASVTPPTTVPSWARWTIDPCPWDAFG